MAWHTQLMLPSWKQSCYYRVHENEMNKCETPRAERERESSSLSPSLSCSLPHDSVEIQYTRTQTLTSTTSDNLLLRSPSFPPHLSFFLAPCFMDAALLHCSLRDSLILWWSQSPSSLILSEPGNHVYNSGNHLNLGKGEKHTGVNEMWRSGNRCLTVRVIR